MATSINTRRCSSNACVLARIVDAESDRICAILDTAHSYKVREEALLELKQLAQNVLIVLESMQPEMVEFEVAA